MFFQKIAKRESEKKGKEALRLEEGWTFFFLIYMEDTSFDGESRDMIDNPNGHTVFLLF